MLVDFVVVIVFEVAGDEMVVEGLVVELNGTEVAEVFEIVDVIAFVEGEEEAGTGLELGLTVLVTLVETVFEDALVFTVVEGLTDELDGATLTELFDAEAKELVVGPTLTTGFSCNKAMLLQLPL